MIEALVFLLLGISYSVSGGFAYCPKEAISELRRSGHLQVSIAIS